MKIDNVKSYLLAQKIQFGDSERKLELTEISEFKGEASIAVVRGEPRMGYELTFKCQLTGVEKTYMEGMTCTVEIEELCDDSIEPAGYEFNVDKLLDTE